jgi:general secretion pathway protein G
MSILRKQALLTILAFGSISLPSCEKANFPIGDDDRTKTEMRIAKVNQALQVFYFDTGRYPKTDMGLNSLMFQPDALKGWKGPYIRNKDDLLDTWNRPLIYNSPVKNGLYKIISLGKDGLPGGEGENADITNTIR